MFFFGLAELLEKAGGIMLAIELADALIAIRGSGRLETLNGEPSKLNPGQWG